MQNSLATKSETPCLYFQHDRTGYPETAYLTDAGVRLLGKAIASLPFRSGTVLRIASQTSEHCGRESPTVAWNESGELVGIADYKELLYSGALLIDNWDEYLSELPAIAMEINAALLRLEIPLKAISLADCIVLVERVQCKEKEGDYTGSTLLLIAVQDATREVSRKIDELSEKLDKPEPKPFTESERRLGAKASVSEFNGLCPITGERIVDLQTGELLPNAEAHHWYHHHGRGTAYMFLVSRDGHNSLHESPGLHIKYETAYGRFQDGLGKALMMKSIVFDCVPRGRTTKTIPGEGKLSKHDRFGRNRYLPFYSN